MYSYIFRRDFYTNMKNNLFESLRLYILIEICKLALEVFLRYLAYFHPDILIEAILIKKSV